MVLVPVAWLGDHVDVPEGLTAEQLAVDLVKVGLEEEAIHLGSQVTGPVVVGKVVNKTPEPQKNGKTVNWCQVDVGSHNLTLSDGADEPRGIVCGAHNFEVGDWVVVSLPGAVLPGDFQIAARKTYGHVSDGMICSARELGIGEDHAGIIVLTRLGHDAADLVAGTDARPLLGLGEQVLEINVTPDRGYCFSMRGVAREYALSTGAKFTDQGLPDPSHQTPLTGGFAVEIADETPLNGVVGCDRFVAQIVRGVQAAAPSPGWMQRRLTQAGMRPLGLAIDVTNYVMLDLGQPLHAYDLEALAAPIVVRRAHKGERLVTLDGQDRALDPEDLLICDSPVAGSGTRAIGLAGVMGGAQSQTAQTTGDLLIEAAHFDPVSIARTARRHKLSSEAAKRFERGVDTNLQRVAVERVVELLTRYGGGVGDTTGTDVVAAGADFAPVTIEFAFDTARRLVGVDYTDTEIGDILAEIGCQVQILGAQADQTSDLDKTSAVALVQIPTWRPDLRHPEDLVEEIARIHGYDQIPAVVPRAVVGTGLTRRQRVRRAVAQRLAANGLVEVLSYPFISESTLDDLGICAPDPRRQAVRLLNPMVDSQNLMRTNLLATLLDTTRRNVSRGNVDVAVFELGLVTLGETLTTVAPVLPGGQRPADEVLMEVRAAVPQQPRHVAAVLTGRREPAGWWGPGRTSDFGDALAVALTVGRLAGVELTAVSEVVAPWHPGRCAALQTPEGTTIGHCGELHPQVVKAFGLPARSVAFELDLDALTESGSLEPVAAASLSVFPVAKEDFAFVVAENVTVAQVSQAITSGAGDLLEAVQLFDVYTGEQLAAGTRSLAFSIRLRAADRTLSPADIGGVREQIVAAVAAQCGGVLRA